MERLTRPNINVDPDTDRFLHAAIGGKEILQTIQALRQCAQSDCSSCGMCPIFPDRECVEHLSTAAASLIERLTAERDALIEQIKVRRSCLDCKHFDYCKFDDATIIECMNCVQEGCPCAECRDSSRWEWRGLPEAPEEGDKHGTNDKS